MSASAPQRRLASEDVIISAPLSFTGSAQRIWKLTRIDAAQGNTGVRVGMILLAVVLIVFAWAFVGSWYLTFGLLLVPYRLLRRGSRKRKRQSLQHRETLAAIQGQAPQPQNVAFETAAAEPLPAAEAPGVLPAGDDPA